MSKMTEFGPRGKDKQIMFVVISVLISIIVIMLLWRYYDTRMAEMEQNVDINQRIPAAETTE